MKSAILLFLAVASVAPAYSETGFYNWTEEHVDSSFDFAKFASDKKWYEVKGWSEEQDPNELENLFFYVNKTSNSEAAVTLVGTRKSDSAKCVYLSGSGSMNLSLPDTTVPAKMIYYISPKYETSRFNIIKKNSTLDAEILIVIQCITVEANGTCSKGLKVNVLSSNRVLSTATNDDINLILEQLELTPTAKYTTTKQDKDCPSTPPVGGANHVTLGLLTLLLGLVANSLI
ncbi:uncharacterized protein LOC135486199 [Lineus longissimus]|uniref:uncharacterized protein LOC135486199 n=1 Tax=Lineus longissimus TaxID=88925 RepID=UPI002B4EAF1F